MVNPAIQNDFSYYRRTLNRLKLSKQGLNIHFFKKYFQFVIFFLHSFISNTFLLFPFLIFILFYSLFHIFIRYMHTTQFDNSIHLLNIHISLSFLSPFSLSYHILLDNGVELRITGEVANRMSLFFAYPTPMMRVLIDATTKFTNSVSFNSFLCYTFFFDNTLNKSLHFTQLSFCCNIFPLAL